MKYKIILLTFILFCFITPVNFSQWEVGSVYNIKKNIPSNGFGVHFSRNLPYQWPDIGFKIKSELDIFQQNEKSLGISQNYLSTNVHFSLIGTFYFRFIQPYLGFGFGIERFSVETEKHFEEKDDFTKFMFLLSSAAGLKLNFSSKVYPFAELQLFKYFYDFKKIIKNHNVSDLQFIGTFGIIIEINLIDRK